MKIFIAVFPVICVSSIRVDFGRPGDVPILYADVQFAQTFHSGAVFGLHAGADSVVFHSDTPSSPALQRSQPPILYLQSLDRVILTRFSSIDSHSLALGIGPGSDLVTTFGSLALVHEDNNWGFLIFNLTEQQFINRYCFAESVMRISTFILRGSINYSFAIGGRFISPVDVQVQIRFRPSLNLITVDESIWLSIFNASARTVVNSTTWIVTDCWRSRDRLPTLQLSLVRDRVLLLSPEDYTRFRNTDSDECEILIVMSDRQGRNQPIIEMNPLLIPGFDSFASGNVLVLCESLHYRE